MHEITHTRMNPMIDPSMHVWGWEIPVYLFLGGLVAGLMIIFGTLSLRNDAFKKEGLYRAMPLTAMFLLSLGMFALFLDLEHKLFTWRLYTTFMPASPMSWGAWILILVYPVLFFGFLMNESGILIITIPVLQKWSDTFRQKESRMKTISYLHIALGILLGMYTGVLLSSLGARPLWSSSVLWLLFLFSGLSSAAAFLHWVSPVAEEKVLLMKADTVFLGTELVILAMLIVSYLGSSEASMRAVHLILSGSYAPMFWVFVCGIGILFPMFLQIMKLRGKIKHTAIAPISVLVGGLLLRILIVSAGQASHW